MRTHCPENERIKHRYQTHLREAMGRSDAAIDKAMAAIRQFELYTRCRPFKRFHVNQAIGFKQHLAASRSGKSGKPLSAATLHATLSALRAFFVWLAGEPGYRQAIRYADTAYFNVSDKDRAIATAKREVPVPTPEQIRHVLASMPAESSIEKRDRALIAFIFLTGARDGAVASMKLKHVDLERGTVFQDAREVRTKFAKTFTSHFFPVGDDVRTIVADWVEYLRREQLFGGDDPLFPATAVKVGASRKFEAIGLGREHWSNATSIRKIFRAAFTGANLPYFNPHAFRYTLTRLGQQLCRTPEEFKAWSQNLGHEKIETTFKSYGSVPENRQAEIIRKLGSAPMNEADLAERMMQVLKEAGHKTTRPIS